jgi:hypothetical protein
MSELNPKEWLMNGEDDRIRMSECTTMSIFCHSSKAFGRTFRLSNSLENDVRSEQWTEWFNELEG